jgi:effector-binding domain-containing protein
MPTWLDAVAVGLLLTIVIYLVYRSFKTKVLFKTLSDMYLQTVADKMLLERKINELYQEIENTKLQQSDGFVKFLSDSRDWAFNYIENVQSALSEFDKTIDSVTKWSETYGTVLNNETPHAEKIRQISLAYKKLQSMLPKNTETPNN